MKKIIKFLIVEDDELSRISLKSMLSRYGEVSEASTSEGARQILEKESFDLGFFDLDLDSQLAGLDLVELAASKKIYSIILSGRDDDASIEQGYLRGCRDYLVKPFFLDTLDMLLKKYFLSGNKEILKSLISEKYITKNKKQIENLDLVEEIVATDRPIFIRGATGTGKTLIASLLHDLTLGRDRPFISLNCSALSENLIESELFGHRKGAFSGAEKNKKGMMELADGGTLFLDEIATLSATTQKKLLKAIEEKVFYPVGSEEKVKVQFRLISATCDDLGAMVKSGEFREDLYFRLEGHQINLLPLRERAEDIPLLIRHFLRNGNRRVVFTGETLLKLKSFSWPGNIRQLQKVVEILKAKSKGIITPLDVEQILFEKDNSGNESKTSTNTIESFVDQVLTTSLTEFIEGMEDQIVTKVYNQHDQKARNSIAALNISTSTFYKILNRAKERGLI